MYEVLQQQVTRLLIFDTGLPFAEGEALREHFEEQAQQTQDKSSSNIHITPIVKYFDFEGFPDHLLSTQAYKAVILNEVIQEYGTQYLLT